MHPFRTAVSLVAIPFVSSLAAQFDPATLTRPAAPPAALPVRVPSLGPAAAGRLVGSDITPDDYIEINPANATYSVLGKLGDDVVASFAWDPIKKVLYATSTRTNNLLVIDPVDGATKVVGPLGTTLMHGLAYNLRNQTLYATNAFSGANNGLFRVDPATGAATKIASVTLAAIGDIAYDPLKDVLYAADITTKSLYTLNMTTGAATLVGAFGGGNQIGTALAFDFALGLFASDNKASAAADDALYKIDTATGAATLIGNLNTGNCLGMTFLDCSPAKWANYGSGFAGTLGVPKLTASNPPSWNKTITLDLTNSRGAPTPGLLLFGPSKANQAGWWGGSFLVDLPTALWFPVTVPTAGLQLGVTIPPNAACGLAVHAQGFLFDPGAPQLLANTAGLELIVGL
jgi:hypothetical protein